MSYMPSSDDLSILKYRSTTLYCKITLMNKQMIEIGSLSGNIKDGSISIDADSDIRRTFTATIYISENDKNLDISYEDWINKFVRVYIGYASPRGEIKWWPQGVFAFNQNGFKYNESENYISISCVDLVSELDGSLSGQLVGLATKIPVDSDIRDAIIKTYQLSGMTKYIIDYWNRKVPYDLEYGTGSTIWDILTELRDLYYPFEMYFDDDTFVCKEIPSGFDDPVVIDADLFYELVISEDASVNYSEVKNCVEVFGASIEVDNYSDKVSYDEKSNTLTLEVVGVSTTIDNKISFLSPKTFTEGTINVTLKNKVTEGSSTQTYTHGPYVLKQSITDEEGNDVDQDASVMKENKYYVIKFSPANEAIYYLGQEQAHAMVKLVDRYPSEEEIEEQKKLENCDNLKFVCVNDPNNTIKLYNSRFTIEQIGQRNKVLSGGDYDNYKTDESTMQVCEYEHWKSCRLTDTISVTSILIPWIDVNQKISYAPKYLKTSQTIEYLIKKIDMTLGDGTMTMTLSRYYPYYPYIVQDKY